MNSGTRITKHAAISLLAAAALAVRAQETPDYSALVRDAVNTAEAQPGATAQTVAAAANAVLANMLKDLAGDGDLSTGDLARIAAAVKVALQSAPADFQAALAGTVATAMVSSPATQRLTPAAIRALASAVAQGAVTGAGAPQAVAVAGAVAKGAMLGASNQAQAVAIASGIAAGAAEGANQAHPGLRAGIDQAVLAGLRDGAEANPNVRALPPVTRVAEAAQRIVTPPQS